MMTAAWYPCDDNSLVTSLVPSAPVLTVCRCGRSLCRSQPTTTPGHYHTDWHTNQPSLGQQHGAADTAWNRSSGSVAMLQCRR